MAPRAARASWIAGAALVIAALTAVVFLARAGDAGAANWPVQFELRSSDNGVLFQFAQDVFSGRNLDWSFSPQVFVFPEIPISLAAYLAAGGSVQGYYLVVAVINNLLLFLGLFAVVRQLFAAEGVPRALARASIAAFPLLLLPLLGSTWLFEYSLAPTYYFGMYLMIIVAPLLLLARSGPLRVVLAVGLALAAASNPLALVFTVPALVCVLAVRWAANGVRCVARPAAWGGGTIVFALLVRVVFFGRLQGASPLDYIDSAIFTGRVSTINAYFAGLLSEPVTATVLILGAVLAAAGLVLAVIIAVRAIRRRDLGSDRRAAALYFALVPVTGLAGTVVLIITDYLYFWPVLILPLVLVWLPLPRASVRWVLPTLTAAFVLVFFVTSGVAGVANSRDYFTYRSDETKCLDAKLPAGVTVGYSTFSDARRLELTSQRPFRLIQLKSSGVRAYWLTNRDYARDTVGRFFYLNDHGDEPAISRTFIENHFGSPDRQFTCAPGETVLIYDAPAKLARIEARYATLPAP